MLSLVIIILSFIIFILIKEGSLQFNVFSSSSEDFGFTPLNITDCSFNNFWHIFFFITIMYIKVGLSFNLTVGSMNQWCVSIW